MEEEVTLPPGMPESDAPAPAPGSQLSWRRVRLYLWALLMVVALDLFGVIVMIRANPKRLTEMVLDRLPFASSIGAAQWLSPDRLEFRNVKVGGFFFADVIVVQATPAQLLRHHIAEIDIEGPQLFTKPLNDALARGKPGTTPAGLDWTITKLVVRRGTLMLDDLAPGLPSIPVRLGAVQPFILNHIKLGRPDNSPSMTGERTVDITNVTIVSPFDPLAPVLAFPLTRIRFTYAELWKHHIRAIELTRPILHLGQDLFWFSDEIRQERQTAPAQGVGAPWQVGHFQVRYGQLAVNAFGQPAVQFPFFFETDVSDIRLDQLDKISAKSVVAIKRLDQEYPDYKIKIVNLSGKLEFSIPPTDAKANNVVPTVHVDELSWNGIAAHDVWSSVTFDPNGIYGKLGGTCEKGYVKANFEVYYTNGFRWNADLFADRIDCQPIADKLAGKYFSLTGSLDGKIVVQGKATEILSSTGTLHMLHPGLLTITSINDLMKRLPGTATAVQHQAMAIGLEAFREYPYDTGALDLNYTSAGGHADLELNGPRGRRNFSVYLHPFAESSKVANAEESH